VASTAFTLVVAVLTVQTSYAKDTELPAVDVPDTVQLWLAPDSAWRIRTFAIDHDIHVYRLGGATDFTAVTIELALEHITKHFADLTASRAVITFGDPNNTNKVQAELALHGLTGWLEVSKDGFAFYSPDNGEYRTQTEPIEDRPRICSDGSSPVGADTPRLEP
jgi:hypothetical protein